MGEKQAVGALPAVTCCLSSTQQSTVSLGLWSLKCRTWQGALAGFASRGRAQPFPLLRQQNQAVGRPGQYWKVPAGVGGGWGSTQTLRAFLFSLTLYLEEARAITQELWLRPIDATYTPHKDHLFTPKPHTPLAFR